MGKPETTAVTTAEIITPELEEKIKAMTIGEQLWKLSPELNTQIFKKFLKEHRPDLNIVVPLGAFGIAIFLIKSGKIDMEKVEKFSKDKLGIELNPIGIKRFAANVSIATMAFTGIKIVGKFFAKNDSEKVSEKEVKDSFKDMSLSKINDMINELKKMKNLRPKAEELLPISMSIIALAIISKPVKEIKALTWIKRQFYQMFGGVAITISEAFDNAILMIATKMNLDVSEDEDIAKIKKFIVMAGVATILIITYGKKISKDEKTKKKLNSFFVQILEGMKKIAPAVFATIVAILVDKKIIDEEDIPDEIKEEIPNEIKEEIPNESKEKIPNEIKEKIPNEIKEEIPNESKEEIPNEIKEDIPDEKNA